MSQDVVHPSAANLLRKPGPAPLDPILDRVLVSGWSGQLAKLFHQLEHELDLPGNTIQRRHTPSIRRSSRNSNRSRLTGRRAFAGAPAAVGPKQPSDHARRPVGPNLVGSRNQLSARTHLFADKKAY